MMGIRELALVLVIADGLQENKWSTANVLHP
jgi:hypothetical protein